MAEAKTEPRFNIGRLVIIIVILFIAFKACENTDSTISEAKKPEEMKSEAYITSQNFMKRNLKAPASADFPFDEYTFQYTNDNIFIINSYVDAQNSFGAQLRINYEAKMQWNGSDWADINNWVLIDLNTSE
ncbi:MAG: hypothetical protein H0W84_00525 [Bacteroidetes bacterium]|nr:hypothetical protein [Bacteroidota bacterium]